MTLMVSAAHAELLAALSRGKDRPRFVIIGAVALGHHIPLARATADVDLALVAEPDEVDSLLRMAGWLRDGRMPQRWHDNAGSKVDVLPATSRLIEAGSISFDGTTRMSLVGFDLALEHTVRVAVPGYQLDVEVARLAALVVLKIVAWLDRPQERTKDLGDLGRMLTSALDEMDDRRWQAPLAGEKFDEQSPIFVGREVSAIAREIHLDRIREFLRRMKDASLPWTALVARHAGYVGDDPEAIATRYLLAFEHGLKG